MRANYARKKRRRIKVPPLLLLRSARCKWTQNCPLHLSAAVERASEQTVNKQKGARKPIKRAALKRPPHLSALAPLRRLISQPQTRLIGALRVLIEVAANERKDTFCIQVELAASECTSFQPIEVCPSKSQVFHVQVDASVEFGLLPHFGLASALDRSLWAPLDQRSSDKYKSARRHPLERRP